MLAILTTELPFWIFTLFWPIAFFWSGCPCCTSPSGTCTRCTGGGPLSYLVDMSSFAVTTPGTWGMTTCADLTGVFQLDDAPSACFREYDDPGFGDAPCGIDPSHPVRFRIQLQIAGGGTTNVFSVFILLQQVGVANCFPPGYPNPQTSRTIRYDATVTSITDCRDPLELTLVPGGVFEPYCDGAVPATIWIEGV